MATPLVSVVTAKVPFKVPEEIPRVTLTPGTGAWLAFTASTVTAFNVLPAVVLAGWLAGENQVTGTMQMPGAKGV